jgi:hypothetical protein
VIDKALQQLYKDIPTFGRFLTVSEIDSLVEQIKVMPGITHHTIGRTVNEEPLTMLEFGSGEKTALIIGVPHSDEPLGSLVTTYFARWLAMHPDVDAFGWRWLFIPILERQGMRLNEGWFAMPESFAAMAKATFRHPTEDQYEWTFPIQYEDYIWTKCRPETLAIKNILEKEQPALLCGLHHSGFTNAYYYLSEDFPEIYPVLQKLTSQLSIPLSDSSPDVPFGKMLSPGFYRMYGLKDYLEYYREKDPFILRTIQRGACSDEWYQNEIGGFSFNCEVPLFLSPKLQDKTPTTKKFTTLVHQRLQRKKARLRYSRQLMKHLENYRDMADPLLYDVAQKHIANAQSSLDHETRMLDSLKEKNITKAEEFENEVIADLFDLFFLGQIWRVTESICVKGSAPKICRLMQTADLEIKSLGKNVKEQGNFYSIPLQKCVQMQLGSILIIADALRKKP